MASLKLIIAALVGVSILTIGGIAGAMMLVGGPADEPADADASQDGGASTAAPTARFSRSGSPPTAFPGNSSGGSPLSFGAWRQAIARSRASVGCSVRTPSTVPRVSPRRPRNRWC